MKIKLIKKMIIGLVVLTQVLPFQSFGENRPAKSVKIVAVVAAPGSNSASKEMAQALQLNLKGAGSYQVIGYETTEQLLQTYSFNKPVADGLASIVSMISSGRKEYSVNANATAALKRLDQAIHEISGLSPSVDTSELLTKAELTKAWVLFQEGKKEEAKRLIQGSYAFHEKQSVVLQGFSTEFRNFMKTISQGAQTAMGELAVTSDPPAVDLFINGHFVGATSKTLKLEAGNYVVGFSAAGRQSVTRKVKVTAGKKVSAQASLAWSSKRVDKKLPTVGNAWDRLSPSEKLSVAAKIGQATSAEKVVVVTVSESGTSSYIPAVQVFDNAMHQALVPISYGKAVTNLKGSSQSILNYFSNHLTAQLSRNALDLYQGDFDKSLMADQRIATRPNKPLTKKPAFWAIVGALVVGGAVASALVLSGGGHGAAPGKGTVVVPLGGF